MDKTQMLETFEKVLQKCAEIPDIVSIEIGRFSDSWSVTFRAWPSKQNEHLTITKCASLKKLTRDESLGWFRASGDNFDIDVVVDKPCKVVGYKTEKRPVTKVIETGDYMEVKVPVTDCDLKKGNVQIGEYEPVEDVA